MTESTDKRQITLLVKGLMQKHGLTALQVEIDFVSAFWRYITERKAGRDISRVREDILNDLQIAAANATKQENMESRVKFSTGLSVDESWYREGVIAFLIARDLDGQTVEKFAEACRADPFNMPKFFQIAAQPALIRKNWGLAFQKTVSPARPEYQPFKTDEVQEQYVTNPQTRRR